VSLVQIPQLTKTPCTLRRSWTYVEPGEVSEGQKNGEAGETLAYADRPTVGSYPAKSRGAHRFR